MLCSWKKNGKCLLVFLLDSGKLIWLLHSYDEASFVVCSLGLLRENM